MLKKYNEKRDFSKTPEPAAVRPPRVMMVIQRPDVARARRPVSPKADWAPGSPPGDVRGACCVLRRGGSDEAEHSHDAGDDLR